MSTAVAKTIDFASLPFEEQKAHFFDVAKRALPLWGYPDDSEFKLLNITENATYLVTHEGYDKLIMRVHSMDYAEMDSIRTELDFINYLRENTDLNLAAPIPSKTGEYVMTIDTPEMDEHRNVVCFTFAAGKAPRDSADDTESLSKIMAAFGKVPNAITLPLFRVAGRAYDGFNSIMPPKSTLNANDRHFYQLLGEIAAKLHVASSKWERPEYFTRISWDWDGTFGPGWNNYYGKHYQQCEFLSDKEKSAIDECVALMGDRIEAYGKDPSRYGLIHSDLRMSNLLEDGDKITVLDFDDFGCGWYLTDIAGVVGFAEHRPDLKEIVDEIVTGYTKVRELTEDDIREIPTFIMLRRIGLIECLQYHLNNTDVGSGEAAEINPEIMQFFCTTTADLAKKYVKEFKDLPMASPVE